jgi:hypothetical protein
MSEQELKTLLGVYQQKTYELFTQNVALEAKVSNLSSLVEVLTKRLNDITNPVQEESKPTRKTPSKKDSGEF